MLTAIVMLNALFVGHLISASATDQQTKADEKRTPPEFHVVGYLPDYRIDDIDPDVGQYLTDLVCFSAAADPSGDLQLGRLKPEHIRKVQTIKQKHALALHLCIGGWNRSGGFPKLAASPVGRERFAAAVTTFCRENGFDGADLDWEHPASAGEYRDYAALLASLKQAFKPHGLQLTVAVAGWQALPADAVTAVDRVHLMAYDDTGRHSTFDFAKADVARLVKSGVPPEKICLGVPFYGRDVKDRTRVMTYSQIVKKYHPENDVDEVGGVYFNGVATIEQKTTFALENKLAGVMVWEIGQDVNDKRSLLRVVRLTAPKN